MLTFSKIKPHSFQLGSSDRAATVSDLVQLKSELLTAIGALLLNGVTGQAKRWLKSYEVRKMLNVSAGTLQTLRNKRKLPFTRVGGILYYDIEDINNLLFNSKNIEHDDR